MCGESDPGARGRSGHRPLQGPRPPPSYHEALQGPAPCPVSMGMRRLLEEAASRGGPRVRGRGDEAHAHAWAAASPEVRCQLVERAWPSSDHGFLLSLLEELNHSPGPAACPGDEAIVACPRWRAWPRREAASDGPLPQAWGAVLSLQPPHLGAGGRRCPVPLPLLTPGAGRHILATPQKVGSRYSKPSSFCRVAFHV